jgi:signal peptidase
MTSSTEAALQSPDALPSAHSLRTLVRKTLSGVGTVMSVLLVMMAAVLMVVAIASRFSSGQDYTVFGHPVLVVLSGSMTPAIDTGDLIFDNHVSALQATQLTAGQIITFYDAPGSPRVFTHRIVKVVHQGTAVLYRTKGDYNNAADSALRPSRDVIGIYRGKIPYGGYVLSALHRPIVLGLLLAAPVLWFVSGLLRQWAETDESKSNQRPRGAFDEGDL